MGKYRIEWTQAERTTGKPDKLTRLSLVVEAVSLQEAIRAWQRRGYINATLEAVSRVDEAENRPTSVNTH